MRLSLEEGMTTLYNGYCWRMDGLCADRPPTCSASIVKKGWRRGINADLLDALWSITTGSSPFTTISDNILATSMNDAQSPQRSIVKKSSKGEATSASFPDTPFCKTWRNTVAATIAKATCRILSDSMWKEASDDCAHSALWILAASSIASCKHCSIRLPVSLLVILPFVHSDKTCENSTAKRSSGVPLLGWMRLASQGIVMTTLLGCLSVSSFPSFSRRLRNERMVARCHFHWSGLILHRIKLGDLSEDKHLLKRDVLLLQTFFHALVPPFQRFLLNLCIV